MYTKHMYIYHNICICRKFLTFNNNGFLILFLTCEKNEEKIGINENDGEPHNGPNRLVIVWCTIAAVLET